MSDASPLPAHPNIEHYRKRAKALVKAGAMPTLAKAQFQIAQEHGFAGWPTFVRHVGALTRARSRISRFEQAVDAIVAGDAAALTRLLREDPALVRARSTRAHQSTLLHYVSANGVEDFRQRTPKNIVVIARMLLDAGADVNAESTAYGGRSTPINLTATSIHPAIAGVQNELLRALLDRGATIDGSDVVGCLRNGRGPAAEFLAARGVALNLEGASGVGRLDLVERFFDARGRVKRPASRKQMDEAFAAACGYGRTRVVEFLLERGMNVAAKLRTHGHTGLHAAAGGGHVDTVALLLKRRAPIDARDDSFGATPLGWALHGWSEGAMPDPRADYHSVVEQLVEAGAPVNPAWLTRPDEFGKRVRADARMRAALQRK